MPPSGQSYEPIRPKIELGRDFVPIYAYMKYEIDQRNIQGARALTGQKFTDGPTDGRTDARQTTTKHPEYSISPLGPADQAG